MPKTFKTGWYVIYVKSCQEKRVSTDLLAKGYETFLPLIKTKRQWSDRKKIIEVPLISSYVFVNVKTRLEFVKALDVKGACGYVRFGSEYARVQDEEIFKIKLLIGAEEISDVKVCEYRLKVGEFRKIKSGPLSGLECEILEVKDNKNKITIRMNSIQKNITAIIPSYSFYEEFEVA